MRSLARAVLLGVLVALLEVFVGIAIVSDPHIGYATLAILIGIWLIVSGIGTIALGLTVHRAAQSWSDRPFRMMPRPPSGRSVARLAATEEGRP